jgi:hypothetical protein
MPYITSDEPLPKYLCRFERPWDGVRCNRDQCSFAHLWGRVRFLIKSRAAKENVCHTIESQSNSFPQLSIHLPELQETPIVPDLGVSPIPYECDCPHNDTIEEVLQKLETMQKEQDVCQALIDICRITEPEPEEWVVAEPVLEVSDLAEPVVEEAPSKPEEAAPYEDDYYDEYDDFDPYDFKPSFKSGGGSRQKQSPYSSRHVRIQEQNLARARERTVIKNADRINKSSGFN